MGALEKIRKRDFISKAMEEINMGYQKKDYWDTVPNEYSERIYKGWTIISWKRPNGRYRADILKIGKQDQILARYPSLSADTQANVVKAAKEFIDRSIRYNYSRYLK